MVHLPASNHRDDAARTDVLLIDDSVTDFRLLMEMMTLRDLNISVALDGTRGYQQAVVLQPGLVLLDACRIMAMRRC
jgi:PleD family two-component response regulator